MAKGKIVSTRYRGHRIIIKYFDDKTCYAVVTKTSGSVSYYEGYWSVVMLDRIVEMIDRFIGAQEEF